jgi:hypothetical protein
MAKAKAKKTQEVAPATQLTIEDVKALTYFNTFSGKTKVTVKNECLTIQSLDNGAEELDQDLAKLNFPTLSELKAGLNGFIETGALGSKYAITFSFH